MPPVQKFVAEWVAAWNARDLDALLAPFHETARFTSPFAAKLLGGSGMLNGKAEIRAYWERGLEMIPDLHFVVERFFVGLDVLVIQYRNQRGQTVDEILIFDGDQVAAGYGTYLPDAPTDGG